MAAEHEAVAAGAAAAKHGAGGLPQFDPTWWPGQIVWLLIIFAVLYVLFAYVFVPKVGGAIVAREDKISGDVAEARRLKDQAEQQAAAAAAQTAEARARAQRLGADAKAKAEADVRSAAEEAKLADKLAAAEAQIGAARDQAMTNVQAIAAETAQAIVEKLTGQPASADELAAAATGRA
jgi:F-type H+-transporting ATPase subunit b